ncbi:cell envelope integrity EipB family protein [Telmatospirillum sp.]|uniref:cell envelope integrity EipB family protein n=1 Tax=Telmatospirillum sp. TaxID=2079197 RepID=UPI00284A4777|nr:cell envelope integrity EipB family protein [Telmatospirillum sp.]MDR3441209.1 cell envelope integrity EipB family protein [Telmatospirillum sp.]
MRAQVTGLVFGGALAACAAADVLAAPAGFELVPHKAVYSMALNATKLGGGVTGASGAMTYKFGDTCDGWTVENRTALTFSYSDGAPVATSWDFVTWESKDGLHYRFRVRSTRDGVVSEEINGIANLDGLGKGGVAKFSQPEQKTIKLPKGTLFPTEHTVRLIENAQRGERMLERTLFDGTGTDGPFNVNAIIGKPYPANANVSPAAGGSGVSALLLSAPSWRMNMAFFVPEASEPTPDYEVSLRYYQNGVADEVIQSFGNFSLKGTLQKLEPLPKPDC